MLFIEIPRAMAGRGICIAAQKSNKPRKWLLKGKQMFVYKVIEKEASVAGRWQRGRISGIQTVRGEVAVRCFPFALKGKQYEKRQAFRIKACLFNGI